MLQNLFEEIKCGPPKIGLMYIVTSG